MLLDNPSLMPYFKETVNVLPTQNKCDNASLIL